MNKVNIGNKTIGEKDSCFIIAEAGVNHNNDLEQAKELILKAAKAGADAIKFQNYTAEKLVTRWAPRFWDWAGEVKKQATQYDSYSLLDKMPKQGFIEMVKYCKENGIIFMSTPFDKENCDMLDEIGVQAYKIASCDSTNIPFLKYVAKKQKPLVVATGTANIEEIKEAIDAIYSTGNKELILLHCTLCYPTKFEDANLRMMETMKKEFPDIPIGLSDHTLGTTVPLAAVALGAKVIEKHYTINKKLMLSADHWLSVDDTELKQMVEQKNNILEAMGISEKKKVACEEPTFKYARRSVVSVQDIPKGTKITEDMIDCKRPGTGIAPKFFDKIVGKITLKDIKDDSLIEWKDIREP